MEQHEEMLKNLETSIQAKIDQISLECKSTFPAEKFENRKDKIMKIYMMRAKTKVNQIQAKQLRNQRASILEEYERNQSDITDFETKQKKGLSPFLSYLSGIYKPLERMLSVYEYKATKTLKIRSEKSISTLEALVQFINEVPMKIAAIKEAAANELAIDEEEIALLEEKYRNFEVDEANMQQEINSIEATTGQHLEQINVIKKAMEKANQKQKKCQNLNAYIQELRDELLKGKKLIKTTHSKQEIISKANLELTEKVTSLENNLGFLRAGNENLKKTIGVSEKRIKYFKSKAGQKIKLSDIEVDPNYKDVAECKIIQEHKNNIAKLNAEGEQIVIDTKKIQEKNEPEIIALNNLKNLLENVSAAFSQLEIEWQKAEAEEKQKMDQFEDIEKEIETAAKQNKEKLECLKKSLESKNIQKQNLETLSKKLADIKNSLDEAKKKKKLEKKHKRNNTQAHPKEKKISQVKSQNNARPGTPRPDQELLKSFSPVSELNLNRSYKFDFPHIQLYVEDESDASESMSNFGSLAVGDNTSLIDDEDEL